MKNKVWENPTMTALNAKETMEDGIDPALICLKCWKLNSKCNCNKPEGPVSS